MILVVGAQGLVGSELAKLLEARGVAWAGRSHADCDISRAADVQREVRQTSARVVINCAAYNAVDRAEQEEAIALAINRDGARNVAQAAPALVHYSTDFVFDGVKKAPYVESDAPHPLGAYGRSKSAGDEAVRASNPRHWLLRVGNLYGRAGKGFASTLLARLRRGERVRTDGERQLQPTWGRAVAEQTFALVTGDAPHGLYHVMCHGQTTWADWSRELARLGGCNPDLIDAVSYDALTLAAARPRYSVLENRALAALGPGADRMPHWRDALVAYLEEELRR